MDDYEKEIADLQSQIEQLEEEDEPDRDQISDLRMQVEILNVLYGRAQELFAAGRAEPEIRTGLTMHGYGEWNFDNVYSFVFETVVDFPADGHHSFVGEIREADFAGLLHPG